MVLWVEAQEGATSIEEGEKSVRDLEGPVYDTTRGMSVCSYVLIHTYDTYILSIFETEVR